MEDVTPEQFENPEHQEFVRKMQAAGYEVREYGGRNFYEGPAVVVERYETDDVVIAAGRRLTRDNLGHQIVMYPA